MRIYLRQAARITLAIMITLYLNNQIALAQCTVSNCFPNEGSGTTTIGDSSNNNVTLTNSAEKYCGCTGDDTISGLDGNDYLHGNEGQDTIYGNAGNDFIRGGSGTDILRGQAGNDCIESNPSDGQFPSNSPDIIYGGGDDDTIIWRETSPIDFDVIYTQAGNDKLILNLLQPTFALGINAIRYQRAGSLLYIKNIAGDLFATINEFDQTPPALENISFKEFDSNVLTEMCAANPNNLPFGQVDPFLNNTVSGWAYDHNSTAGNLSVRIDISNSASGSPVIWSQITTASITRTDAGDKTPVTNIGFSYQLPMSSFTTAGTYYVKVSGIDATSGESELTGSPLTFVVAPTPTPTPTFTPTPTPTVGPTPPSGSGGGYISGSTAGNFEVSDIGSAEYAIPISIPPGASGMQPTLSLSYSSRGPNGLLGVGWSLQGLSAISRCAATLAQNNNISDPVDLDSNDQYCLDGEQLKVVLGSLGGDGTIYRTEHDSFSKITSHGSTGQGPLYFTVYTKTGLKITYGNTSDSRVELGLSDPLIWAANSIEDKFSNRIDITYTETPTEYQPNEIIYTSNPAMGVSGNSKVKFIYSTRPDQYTTYYWSSPNLQSKRLKEIRIYNQLTIPFRRYYLNYQQSPRTGNSQLTSVIECGTDGTCFAPTEFTWSDTGFTTGDFSGVGGGYWTGTNATTSNTRVGDLNGDGKNDLFTYGGSGSWLVYLSTGTSFEPVQNWTGHLGGLSNNIIGDFNADGRTDIAANSGGSQWHVCLSTGTSFNCSYWNNGANQAASNIFTGDFNGDGYTDTLSDSGSSIWDVCLSTGSNFTCSTWNGHNGQGANNFVGDFDGDGRSDIIAYAGGGSWHTCVSEGNNFSCTYKAAHSGSETNNMLGDFNGDGKTDLISEGQFIAVGNRNWNVCLSTGPAFECTTWSGHSGLISNNIVADFNGDRKSDIAAYAANGIWDVRTSIGSNFNGPSTGPWTGHSGGVPNNITADYNGDGLADISTWTGSGNSWHIKLGGGLTADLAVAFKNGLGAEVFVNYGLITDPQVHTKDNDAIYPRIDVGIPIYVVKSIDSSNGIGGFRSRDYTYAGAELSLNGRGFRGFRYRTETDIDSGITETRFYNQFHRHSSNLVEKVERRLSSGVLIGKTEKILSFLPSPTTDIFNSVVTQESQFIYELDGSLVNTVVTNYSYDNYLNVLTRSVNSSGGYTENSNYTYTNDESNWILSRLISSAVTKTAPGTTSITRNLSFEYDPLTGIMKKETIEPNHPTLEVVKEYTHDGFGNVLSSIVSGVGLIPRTTTSTYQATGRFMTSATNPLGQTEVRSYSLTALATVTDPNGLTTAMSYDGFLRETNKVMPDGTNISTRYSSCDSTCPGNAAFLIGSTISGSGESIIYNDILGREVRRSALAFDGRRILVDTEYDSRGRKSKQSHPYFNNENPIWIQFSYDNFDRVVTMTEPGNRITSNTYQGFTSTVINPNNQATSKTVNNVGSTISATDALGFSVSRKYDGFGNIVERKDSANNPTIYTYDLSGNLLSENDPNTGLTTYQYNSLGELLSKTDARGVIVNFTYDLLGRLVQRSSGSRVESFIYDTSQNGIGKIAAEYIGNDYSKTYSYDTFSRNIEETVGIAEGKFTTSYSYDQYSRIDLYTYPSGFAVQNIYGANGELSEVRNAATSQMFWKADIRDALSNVAQATYGNGLVKNISINPTTKFLNSIQVGGILNIQLQHDAIGNITQRADLITGEIENFSYDNLNRLIQTVKPGQPNENITYDTLGNITTRTNVGIYQYLTSRPNAATHILGSIPDYFTYDAVGNRVSANGQTVSYNYFNKPDLIIHNGSLIEFNYDPNHQAYRQMMNWGKPNGISRVMIGSLYERDNYDDKLLHRHYVVAGSKRVAVHTTVEGKSVFYVDGIPNTKLYLEQTHYYHGDHLGSTVLLSDENGNVAESSSFDPWGMRRNASWGQYYTPIQSIISDKGFGGHQQFDTFGLVNMGGRLYDNRIGRFLNPDPAIQNIDNTQNYNRYSYVLNNPLSYSDPTGYFFKSLFRTARTYAPTIITLVAAYYGGEIFAGLVSAEYAALAKGAGYVLGSSLVSSGIYGNSFTTSLKYAIAAQLAAGAGNVFGSFLKENFVALNAAKGVTINGIVGGAIEAVQGGNIQHGFLKGIVKTVGGQFGGIGEVISSGTASMIGGGKFANGALSGSFDYITSGSSAGGDPPTFDKSTVTVGEAVRVDGELNDLSLLDRTLLYFETDDGKRLLDASGVTLSVIALPIGGGALLAGRLGFAVAAKNLATIGGRFGAFAWSVETINKDADEYGLWDAVDLVRLGAARSAFKQNPFENNQAVDLWTDSVQNIWEE